MAGIKRPPKNDQPSIKYRLNPVEGASIELADLYHKGNAAPLSSSSRQNIKNFELQAHQIFSTGELISAVNEMWDFANRLNISESRANVHQNHSGYEGKDGLSTLSTEENGANGRAPVTIDGKYFCVDLRTTDQFPPIVQPNLHILKVTQKVSVFEPCNEKNTRSLFWRLLGGAGNLPDESWKGKGLASVGISYELGYLYRWMREIMPGGPTYLVSLTETKNRRIGECCIPEDTTSPASNLAIGCADYDPNMLKFKDAQANLRMNPRPPTSLYSDYFLRTVHSTKVDDIVSWSLNSCLYADYHIASIATCYSARENQGYLSKGNEVLESKRKQPEDFENENGSRTAFGLSGCGKPHYAFAKQEHAFAGALAGIFVSLCLHPIDTVKTVIQSCHADQKSIFEIGRSIVSERGSSGLYRGIASNITSSAPISAVYTFTYESVKGALLPLFPEEYYSLAHCLAGGCASIATSFIFTPSERIKQQMQVGSHYHNCWNAFVRIIGRGGLPSLYAGWCAVLCRNVPHSIVKFYTYESLKQMMSSSPQFHAQPNTLQTLVCGGLAGSTAALFTTPFDVVKTRLQTQVPGSTSQYNSVYHALQEIGKHEGFGGLYRGLIPRLVMYMSQGAIFFASYEFFKSLFALDAPVLNAHRIEQKDDKEGAATSRSLSSSSPPLSPPKVCSFS